MSVAAKRDEGRSRQEPEAQLQPLHSAECEQQLIGAILEAALRGEVDVIAEVAGYDLAPAFHDPARRQIFTTLCEMHRAGQPLELGVLADRLRWTQDGAIKPSAIAEWIERVAEWSGIPSLARHYVGKLRDLASRRQIVETCREIAIRVRSDGAPLADFVPDLVHGLIKIPIGAQFDRTLADTLQDFVARLDGPGDAAGIRMPLRELQSIIGGWKKGHLIQLAARSQQGKTSFALQSISMALDEGTPCAFISLETSRVDVLEQLVCQRRGLSLFDVTNGRFTDAEHVAMHEEAAHLSTLPLQVFDREKSWPKILIAARRMVANGAQMVVIDHQALIQNPDSKAAWWEKQKQITGEAQDLADKMQVPVILLNQLARDVEKGKSRKKTPSAYDFRPTESDLRGSGSSEEDAHEVILLYRPGHYIRHKFDLDGGKEAAEVIVAKQKRGPVGRIQVVWDPRTTTFADWYQGDLWNIDGEE